MGEKVPCLLLFCSPGRSLKFIIGSLPFPGLKRDAAHSVGPTLERLGSYTRFLYPAGIAAASAAFWGKGLLAGSGGAVSQHDSSQ